MNGRWAAAGALAAMVIWPGALRSQSPDSVPVMRHILALDYARLRPFSHSYDMLVVTRDSTVSIGRRDVALTETGSADSSAGWLLVESRTGVVNSTDSIFIAADLRPVRWHSVVGPASLDLAFTSDSTTGVVRVGDANRRTAIAVPPELIVSSSAIEMLAALLPLSPAWSDSANTLVVDVAGARTTPALLSVTLEDSVTLAPGATARPCWVLSLKAGQSESRLWVDRATMEVLRTQTTLPPHVGTMLEYRIRPAPVPLAP